MDARVHVCLRACMHVCLWHCVHKCVCVHLCTYVCTWADDVQVQVPLSHLGVVSQEHPLVCQEPDKVVGEGGLQT